MMIEYAARVEIGPKNTNDDRVLVGNMIIDQDKQAIDGHISIPSLAVVCDGCGGYNGGGLAAQLVLQTVVDKDVRLMTDPQYLSRVLELCQDSIQRRKTESPQYSKMCTTIAGCVFYDEGIIFFHSGDSRIYRHDKWSLARMTKDHSAVQEMIDLGVITAEEALMHPKRNIITRCIGYEGLPPEIYVSHSPINPGEKYLLCSDGLWESVDDLEIKAILDAKISISQMVDRLVSSAIEHGAEDNISACICSLNSSVDIETNNKPYYLD